MVVIAWLILAVSCSFGKSKEIFLFYSSSDTTNVDIFLACTFENEAKTENGTVHFCDGDLQQSCPNGALCQYSDIRYANVCCHEISTDYFKRKPLQKTNGKRFRQQGSCLNLFSSETILVSYTFFIRSLFGPSIPKAVGLQPVPQLFYNMPYWLRLHYSGLFKWYLLW